MAEKNRFQIRPLPQFSQSQHQPYLSSQITSKKWLTFSLFAFCREKLNGNKAHRSKRTKSYVFLYQSLRSEQQEAKTLYKQNVTDYAREQLGRPLEKVSMFFDGVTQELDNGRREDEIRLLQAYNKSELKKQIKQYPGNSDYELQKRLKLGKNAVD